MAGRGGRPWDCKGIDPIERRKGKRREEGKVEVGAALLLGDSKSKTEFTREEERRVCGSKTENNVVNKHRQTFLNTGPG